MKSSLQPGVALIRSIVVDRARTIGFMGEDARVYATPSMILDMEHTCRELILQHADAGEDSVGIEVAVKHLAATLTGQTVEITAKVVSVEGRKVTFEITVDDELDTAGAGMHSRFVVDREKTVERLKAKAAKLAELKK
jgi:predicted thioesterase